MDNIKEVYPSFNIESYEVNNIGQNNAVIIINKSLVFRFPKYTKGINKLKEEKEILEAVKGRVSIPTPSFVYQSFDNFEIGKVFIGYKLIKGEPFWRETFFKIKDEYLKKALAIQVTTFLKEIHSISKEKLDKFVNLEEANPIEVMDNLYKKIKDKLFPFIRDDAKKEISASFKDFINNEENKNIKINLIHGDFGASNILYDKDLGKISGIIDFGGSCLGDAAYDFAGILTSYGEDFFNMCINLYPGGNEIKKRVRFYKSTFALQEALHGIENDDKEAFEDGIKDYR